jgi:hypothetical protein
VASGALPFYTEDESEYQVSDHTAAHARTHARTHARVQLRKTTLLAREAKPRPGCAVRRAPHKIQHLGGW